METPHTRARTTSGATASARGERSEWRSVPLPPDAALPVAAEVEAEAGEEDADAG